MPPSPFPLGFRVLPWAGREKGKLSFHTTKLAPLAIIQSRVRLMPYMSWHTRPCAGEQGGEAILSLEVPPSPGAGHSIH